MTSDRLHELAEELDGIPAEQKLWLIERLAHGLRRGPPPTRAELAAAAEAMANDPDIQRVLRNEDVNDWSGIDPACLVPRGYHEAG